MSEQQLIERLMDMHREASRTELFIYELLGLFKRRHRHHDRPTKLTFAVPLMVSKQTGEVIMPGSITVTDDHDEKVPLLWTDDAGTVHPDTSGTTVTSDNAAVISGGDVASDGTYVLLRTAGDGTCNVTVTNGALTDTISVTVGAPVATAVALNAANATQVPKGTPATMKK